MSAPPKHSAEMSAADWETYVRLASAIIDLPVAESSIPGVVSTLMTTAKVAQPLLEIELPEGAEMAPDFTS